MLPFMLPTFSTCLCACVCCRRRVRFLARGAMHALPRCTNTVVHQIGHKVVSASSGGMSPGRHRRHLHGKFSGGTLESE